MQLSVINCSADVRPGLYKSSKEGHRRQHEKKAVASKKSNLKPLKVSVSIISNSYHLFLFPLNFGRS